jgi:hypothetical protein
VGASACFWVPCSLATAQASWQTSHSPSALPRPQVLEAREEVESTDDPARLKPLLAAAQAQEARAVGELSAAFKARDLGRAAALVAQLTYIVRLEEAITAKL